MQNPPPSDTTRFGLSEAIKHLLTQPHSFPVCTGPDSYQSMPTCGKCLVIVGLRNLLAGRAYYEDPTTVPIT